MNSGNGNYEKIRKTCPTTNISLELPSILVGKKMRNESIITYLQSILPTFLTKLFGVFSKFIV
ncbi:hypothetical protein L9F63_009582, partial [Diploptera punctata]